MCILFSYLQKKARVAFSDQEGRNELLGGEDSHSSEDQVGFNSHKSSILRNLDFFCE